MPERYSDELLEPQLKAQLDQMGVNVPRGVEARDPEEARFLASQLSPPLVVKLVAPKVVHKRQIGGVRLGARSPDEVYADASTVLANARAQGITNASLLVEEHISSGLELSVGLRHDWSFGQVVRLSPGGYWAELPNVDIVRCAPLSFDEITQLCDTVDRWLTAPLADQDKEALANLLRAVSGMEGLGFKLAAHLLELDLNPIIIQDGTATAVDAYARISAEPFVGTETLEEWPQSSGYNQLDVLFQPSSITIVSGDGRDQLGERIRKSYADSGFAGPIRSMSIIERELTEPHPNELVVASMHDNELGDFFRGQAGRANVVHLPGSHSTSAGVLPNWLNHPQRMRPDRPRVLGPKSPGVHSPAGGLSFLGRQAAADGRIAVASQSQGILSGILDLANSYGIEIAKSIVIPARSWDIDIADIVAYFVNDESISSIGLYLESVEDGRRLRRVFQNRHKPIVLLRGGRSERTGEAVKTHTGATLTSERVWNAVANEGGIVTVRSLEALMASLHYLDQNRTVTPPSDDPRLLLVGQGGAFSILAADSCVEAGLRIEPLMGNAMRALEAYADQSSLPTTNPLDLPVSRMAMPDNPIAIGDIFDKVLGVQSYTDAVAQLCVPNIARECRRNNFDDGESVVNHQVDRLIFAAQRHPDTRFTVVLREGGVNTAIEVKAIERLRASRCTVLRRLDDAVDALRWSGQ